MPRINLPKVGSLVVVSHWRDFYYLYDAVKLGQFEEYRDGYWYIIDDERGYRYCRKVSNREVKVGKKRCLKN
jgi:hypothetical protein